MTDYSKVVLLHSVGQMSGLLTLCPSPPLNSFHVVDHSRLDVETDQGFGCTNDSIYGSEKSDVKIWGPFVFCGRVWTQPLSAPSSSTHEPRRFLLGSRVKRRKGHVDEGSC